MEKCFAETKAPSKEQRKRGEINIIMKGKSIQNTFRPEIDSLSLAMKTNSNQFFYTSSQVCVNTSNTEE